MSAEQSQGGEEHPLQPLHPQPGYIQEYSVVELPNGGREADTFARHVADRYDTLANYTVFTQVIHGLMFVLGGTTCQAD